MKRVVNEMHMKDVTITYGMTETSPGRYVSLSCALFLHSRTYSRRTHDGTHSFQTEGNSPLEKRVETVGRVHPHTEVHTTMLCLLNSCLRPSG